MTEKQIIERLILELECTSELIEYGEENESQLRDNKILISQLKEAGYKVYPEHLHQTEEEKEEIQNLIKMNPLTNVGNE